MTLGELLGALLGWLGNFVEWLFRWIPIYVIVQVNERGVKYPRGQDAIELDPGIHWYIPNLTEVVKHHVSRCVLYIEPLSLETGDEPSKRVQVGAVLTYHVTDVLTYEVENYDADESMHEVAQGALQDIITNAKWTELQGQTGEGTRLGNKLAGRMGKALEKFGVAVESCRPTDMVTLDTTQRVFGVDLNINLSGK